ncbi:MAG: peptide-methionine (S)-S-oxide reductase MsrA [Rhodanobacteraceae bacterium]
MRFPRTLILPLLSLLFVVACSPGAIGEEAHAVPALKLDAPRAAKQGTQTAVLAGGCFWGLQWVFEHVKGVTNVTSGYSGGNSDTAQYERVSEGGTGHAESVRIEFDPAQVSYGQLLRVYFSAATDPTQLNRQGPDVGTQYRGVIFYTGPQQEKIARAYIAQLGATTVFGAPIVTQVVRFNAFYPAEEYHQDYARLHPDEPYIAINDAPKVVHLERLLPQLYRARPLIWHGASGAIAVDVM